MHQRVRTSRKTLRSYGAWSSMVGPSLVRNSTRVRPSKSMGYRRFCPAVSNENPESVGAAQAMAAEPSPIRSSTSLQIRSRVRAEYTPTYTPARISANHNARRPRNLGGAFSVTMTSIARRNCGKRGRLAFRRFNRRRQTTRFEDCRNRGNDAFQQVRTTKCVSTCNAHLSLY